MEENTPQASSSIKVVKFSSGEEVVAVVEEFDTEIIISNPAKIVIYSSTNEQKQIVECLRLTSYLANIKEKSMSILKNYIIYIAEPSDDMLKMYNAYLSFMEGLSTGVITAEMDSEVEPIEAAWEYLS